jgi:hypothetical protein
MSELEIINGKVDRVLDTQGKIFDEIKALRQDFNDQKVTCEKRFTKMETKYTVNSKWKKGISNILYVVFGSSATLLGKWIMSKLS